MLGVVIQPYYEGSKKTLINIELVNLSPEQGVKLLVSQQNNSWKKH